MRPRYTKIRDQRDGNHADIVNALRGCGIEVIETERPVDALVFNETQAGWIEIKTEARNATIRRSQLEFIAKTKMPVALVKTPDEALKFAKTMEGLSQRQKDALAVFLMKDKGKAFHPAKVEGILGL